LAAGLLDETDELIAEVFAALPLAALGSQGHDDAVAALSARRKERLGRRSAGG
jgi:hypothetical protein